MKCELNKERACEILNKELGDCEIDSDNKIVWRCPHYKQELKAKLEEMKNGRT